ncbi:uncharacterized protein CMC5_033130 [Chondromyces crocatus]|uniref:Uncharacterized protein n=2 Tax=Chondromyces crocatus TaxID=52 RepID=A0A0K1EE74_CHOCO|nr:uncharacterized protein CMC5_033130 [Chondromyces crocatus]
MLRRLVSLAALAGVPWLPASAAAQVPQAQVPQAQPPQAQPPQAQPPQAQPPQAQPPQAQPPQAQPPQAQPGGPGPHAPVPGDPRSETALQEGPPAAAPPSGDYGPPVPPGGGHGAPFPYPYPPVYMEPAAFPRTLPYRERVPPPPGYRLETTVSRPLVISGGALLGTAYLVAALTGGTIVTMGERGASDHLPLFVPLAGPFITMATAPDAGIGGRHDGPLGMLLLFDGVAQVTGAVLLVAGLLSNKPVWVRDDIPQKAQVTPRVTLPEFTMGPQGGGVRVRF